MFDQMTIKKNMRLFYAFSAFSSMDFTRGIFVLYFLSQGFDHAQVGFFQSVLFLSILIFELPSGMFADKFRRKWSVLIGLLVTIAGFIGVLLFKDFFVVSGLFALKGLGMAFRSGADSALLYDSLKVGGAPVPSYLDVSAKARNIGNLALAFAIWLGGTLESEGMWTATYLAAVVAYFLAGLLILAFREAPRVQTISEESSVAKSFRNYLSSKAGKRLVFLIIGLCFFEASATPLYIFGQSYFRANSLSVANIGLIMSIASLSNSFWYFIADYFKRFQIKTLIFVGMALFSSLCLGFALPFHSIGHIVLFIFLTSFPNLIFVFTDAFLHDQVPSEIRASLMSVQSLCNSVTISISYIVLGFFMDHGLGVQSLTLLSAPPLVSLLILAGYFRAGRGDHNV